MSRDYKKEYRAESSTRKKQRAQRNKARRIMEREGRVEKGDGKHVDHKKPLRNGGKTVRSNLRVQSKSRNSSANGHRKGEVQRKKS